MVGRAASGISPFYTILLGHTLLSFISSIEGAKNTLNIYICILHNYQISTVEGYLETSPIVILQNIRIS